MAGNDRNNFAAARGLCCVGDRPLPSKRIDPQHHQVLRDEIFVCWSKIVLAAAAGGSSIKMAFPLH
jgi:hypothetical protein